MPSLRTQDGQHIQWLSCLPSADSHPVSLVPAGWQVSAAVRVQEAGRTGHHWEGVSVERTQDVPTPPDPTWSVCVERALTRSTKATLCGIEQAPGLSQALSSLFKRVAKYRGEQRGETRARSRQQSLTGSHALCRFVWLLPFHLPWGFSACQSCGLCPGVRSGWSIWVRLPGTTMKPITLTQNQDH